MKIKIVSLLLIVTLFITMFATSCFADFEFTTIGGESFTFSDLPFNLEEYPYYMIECRSDRNQYVVYYCSVPFLADSRGGYWPSDNKNYYQTVYNYSSKTYGSSQSVDASESTHWGVSSANNIYSSHDVLDSSGNVVFQKASQPVQGTLAKIVEKQETNKVMEEILGILPVIIVVLVGLIAIRKAIAFLAHLLHQS